MRRADVTVCIACDTEIVNEVHRREVPEMTKLVRLGALSRLLRRHPRTTTLTPEEQHYEAAYINWQLEQQFLRDSASVYTFRK